MQSDWHNRGSGCAHQIHSGKFNSITRVFPRDGKNRKLKADSFKLIRGVPSLHILTRLWSWASATF